MAFRKRFHKPERIHFFIFHWKSHYKCPFWLNRKTCYTHDITLSHISDINNFQVFLHLINQWFIDRIRSCALWLVTRKWLADLFDLRHFLFHCLDQISAVQLICAIFLCHIKLYLLSVFILHIKTFNLFKLSNRDMGKRFQI